MKNILIGSFPYVSNPLSYFIDSVKKLGYKDIEFYAASPHCYLDDVNIDRAKEIKKQLDAAELNVEVFTPEQWDYQMSISLDDEKVRNRSFAYYEKALDVASILGAKYMSLISGYGYLNGDPKKDYERGIDGIKKLLEKAKKLNITLLLEIDKESSINTSDKVLKALNDINDDNLKVLLDSNAIYAAKEDFEEAYLKLKDYIKHIHLNDFDKINGTNIIPGEGIMPMNEYKNVLNKYHYDGFVTCELRGYTYQDEPEEATIKALNWLKEE